MKMSRMHVGLGRADQIKARDHHSRNRARREKGMRPFLRGPRIKEQVKNEELERAKLMSAGRELFRKWYIVAGGRDAAEAEED